MGRDDRLFSVERCGDLKGFSVVLKYVYDLFFWGKLLIVILEEVKIKLIV